MDDSGKKTEWWQTFFHGPWQDLQLAGYSEDQNKGEAAFILSALGLQPGARILDVPCGEGRLSIEFSKSGYRSTGIDFNANAVERARKMAKENGITAEFSVADMREFSWTDSFDGAVCFFGSFGYFDDQQNLRFASHVAEALRPGGRFLIDLHVAESIFPKFRERDWDWAREDSPMRILEERQWDLASGRIESTWTFLGRECGFTFFVHAHLHLSGTLRSLAVRRFFAVRGV